MQKLFMLAVVVALPAAATAEDKKSELVREIKVRGLPMNPRGRVTKPLVIDNAQAAAKAITAKDAQAAIQRDVNFEESSLLLFSWSGSGQDRLTPVVNKDKKTVVFEYKRGRTKDLRRHVHLFVIKKKTEWKVAAKGF